MQAIRSWTTSVRARASGGVRFRAAQVRTRSRHAHARRTGSHLSSDARKYHQMLALKHRTAQNGVVQVGKRWSARVLDGSGQSRGGTAAGAYLGRRAAVRPARGRRGVHLRHAETTGISFKCLKEQPLRGEKL